MGRKREENIWIKLQKKKLRRAFAMGLSSESEDLHSSSEEFPRTPSPAHSAIQLMELSEDLGKLRDEKLFCDITLIAEGKTCQAHKAILTARSSVFMAMFRAEMIESKENSVTIDDIRHVVLEEMLRFIYTGQAPNLKKITLDLLVAADKYDLKRLKIMCEEELLEDLSVETAANTLILADRYRAKEWKARTIEFVISNLVAIMATPNWRNVKADLLNELLAAQTDLLNEFLAAKTNS